ncbi:hypothetical protein [Aeromonas hydrophila]|nr:hypothetical protein [Aeromonas hydrophila]CAD7556119.1 hypothetical protein KBAH04_37170 [Aeromonas hydrophila]
MTLILPDICGNIEHPNERVGNRYKSWYESFVINGPHPKDDPEGQRYKYPSSEDCYALRCSILHAGSEEIANTTTKEILGQYHFFKPEGNFTFYGLQVGNVVQLQVDKFCEKVCLGAEEWERGKLSSSNYSDDFDGKIVRIRSSFTDGIKLTTK